jgi:hypothetical protein
MAAIQEYNELLEISSTAVKKQERGKECIASPW